MKKKIIEFAAIIIMAAALSACGKRDAADSINEESVRKTEKVKVTETPISKEIVANGAITVSEEAITITKEAINITEDAIAVTNGAFADIEEQQEEQTEESNIIELNKVMYAARAVNVRSGPGVSYSKVGSLSFNQAVTVTGQDRNTNWYRIVIDGAELYVSNKYLSDTQIASNYTTESDNYENADNTQSGTDYIIVEETDSASQYFTPYPISDAIFSRIYGLSYKENCKVSLDELRYIRVLHYNFNGEVVDGELIVNRKIAQDVCEVFRELYEVRYPIEKIRLVDEYQADDNLSMADNNSSAFNYRVIDGTNRLSNHAKGFAIDINPLYNPYVRTKDGVQQVLPDNAYAYADRNASNPYYIQRGGICYQIFTSHGFTWGGDWVNSKDYQHFEKKE